MKILGWLLVNWRVLIWLLMSGSGIKNLEWNCRRRDMIEVRAWRKNIDVIDLRKLGVGEVQFFPSIFLSLLSKKCIGTTQQ